jgi:hypothetical protein
MVFLASDCRLAFKLNAIQQWEQPIMAEQSPQNEAAAKQLAEERKLLARSHEEYAARMKGRPTPSQEENDLAALGAHFTEHEPDGADPDPFLERTPVAKQIEPAKPAGGGYQTRQATPRPQQTAPEKPPPSSSST